MGTVTCHWLLTICGAGHTFIQVSDVSFVLDASVRPSEGNGQDTVRLPPEAKTLMVGLLIGSFITVPCLAPRQKVKPDQL